MVKKIINFFIPTKSTKSIYKVKFILNLYIYYKIINNFQNNPEIKPFSLYVWCELPYILYNQVTPNPVH